ncbi:MAG: alpha/beta fold hydrolase [Actinobacteria bacterium]|nr:alpha/beta fold hydrolase [Actinomycetota bacterium]
MTWGTGAAVVGTVFLLTVLWWAIPSGTHDALLRPKPTRRLARWARSLLVRLALAALAWPHVVDLFLRTRRAPTATRSRAEVWRQGNTVLWRYDSKERRHPEPVLLVHSLVTKPSILDLTPRRSLVGALLAQGFDVYLLDWGEVTWRQAQCGMVAYVEMLREAEAVTLETSGAERFHVVAYCLGATLVLLRLVLDGPRPVASFAAIAPPVDLSVPGGFRSLLGSRHLRPVLALDGGSCVPAALIRESFHLLRPMALRTQWRRLRRRVSW